MSHQVLLEFENLTKRFPGLIAVKEANLQIRAGEVHSIVGGNGAGKSTLMKMLSGVYPCDSYEGTIRLLGKECRFKSILDAQATGIALIPQDINMANELSVAENLFMSNYPLKHHLVDYDQMYRDTAEILKEFSMDISPTMKVREIGVAQKQLIIIARAMHNDVKVLLLDEPTSTLSDKECKILFEKVGLMKERGIACVFISHRLEEIKQISDVITVMRDGMIVGTDACSEMSEKRIVELMVGRNADDVYPEHDRSPGEVLLKVNHITVNDPKNPKMKIVDDVSFDLRRGEILSMYGLVGAGRSETALTMIGAYAGPVECEMELNGKSIRILSPGDAVEHKIGFLPEDRKRQGVIEIHSVGKNISIPSLPSYKKGGMIDTHQEQSAVDEVIQKLAIKTPSSEMLVRNLSGGNAQKCVLGRWIAADSDILILDEATQGIDVGTKTQIYHLLDALAKEGKAILFISSDLSEVMGVSDRILTMKAGKIINITDGKKADRTQILWEATVGKAEAK
ncbi:MAG: sugar ABC transporter ATP-binding protein [Clostridia bacterium]